MIEAREGIFKAVPLDVGDPAKFDYILNRLVEHESEWTDFQADPAHRRRVAISYVASHIRRESVILEAWQLVEGEWTLVGLLAFTHIVPKTDVQFHPVFFDGKIRNFLGKRELLLRAMDWAFDKWDLHRLSVQLPENRGALVRFCREKLGFRFEGENRTIMQQRVVPYGHLKTRKLVALTPNWREAELGSRRYQALFQGGRWWDMLLLSVTRDEFAHFVREASLCPASSTDPTHSKPSPAI